MTLNQLKVENPNGGVWTYDVAVMFEGAQVDVEVKANSMDQAAQLVQDAGYTLVATPA